MKTGCVIKVYTAHSMGALELLNCLNVTCDSLPHEELRMKIKSIQRKIKRKKKLKNRLEMNHQQGNLSDLLLSHQCGIVSNGMFSNTAAYKMGFLKFLFDDSHCI